MHLKRFRRRSVREALRAAREELGAEALVLSTELVSAGGWRGWMGAREVQITAALDSDVSERRPAASARRPSNAPPPPPPSSAPRDGLVARLVAAGIDRPTADAVASAIPDRDVRGASARQLRQALARLVASLAPGDEAFARAEIFLGPPGVGKTTTIAKIAARERAGHGRTLGVVAADGFRAGAVEQLRIYADVIGAPFRVARTAGELDTALTAARQPLLVDTAGRSPRDPAIRDLLHVASRRRGTRRHLVLAADTGVVSARRILDAYAETRPDRVVVTKLDEADSLSPLLSVLRERQLPISFIAAGQRVPEDLDRATPSLLAGALLRSPAAFLERHS
ncbi:MAG: hypothetical protein IT176_12435 [Acidobacteria bacterium]|nr:hypothetical protein [Acidobacteriota bacterium]